MKSTLLSLSLSLLWASVTYAQNSTNLTWYENISKNFICGANSADSLYTAVVLILVYNDLDRYRSSMSLLP